MMMPVHYHYGEFPPKKIDWGMLIPLLGPASASLARYDALLRAIPAPRILLSPLTTQEAVLSTRIEGTEATMVEVLKYEAGMRQDIIEPKKGDLQEIINYRKAILFAEKQLTTLPLTGRIIKEAHAKLLSGARGQEKDPGNFRKGDNWIGRPGCSKAEAKFIPIEPQQLMDGITAWEKFLHSEQPDLLVQLAIVHAEFEALHPFYDGNGRMGRMLLPLFLFDKKLLKGPNFYMSAYFESHKDEYFERLLSVSRDKDWTGWCIFFLKAIVEQADLNITKINEIIELYKSIKDWLIDNEHSSNTIKVLDFIFKNPVFASSYFVKHSHIPKATALRILRKFTDKQILKVLKEASGPTPSTFIFPRLLNIVR